MDTQLHTRQGRRFFHLNPGYRTASVRYVYRTALCALMLALITLSGCATPEEPEPLANTAATEATTTAAPDGTYATQGVSSIVADPSTAMQYRTILGTEADGTRYSGRVWTDKSVFTGAFTSQTNPTYTVENDGDFLIAFSALGSTQVINGETSTPLDVVLMLDISTSMSIDGTANQGRGPIATLTSEANDLIDSLMTLSPDNRVGVVVYSGGAQTLMDLAHYEKSGTTNYLTLSQQTGAQLSGGGSNTHNFNRYTATARKVAEDGTTSSFKRTSSYMRADCTYLQGALYEGMKMLVDAEGTTYTDAAGNKASRIPAIIVLTDGGTNVMTKSTSAQALSNNWWRPVTGVMGTYSEKAGGNEYLWPQKNGNPLYMGLSASSDSSSFIAPRTLATLMTAGSMKKAVEAHYGTGMQGYAIGLNVDGLSDAESEQLAATMNPSATFVSGGAGHASIAQAYNTFTSYLKGQTPSLTYSGNYLASYTPKGPVTGTYVVAHPPTGTPDLTSVEDLYYVSQYYDANTDNLDQIFHSIYSQLGGTAFHPVSSGGTSDTFNGLYFTDPLGEYMDLTSFKVVRIFGTTYEVVKTSDDTTTETWSVVDSNGATNVEVQNPSYVNPTYFNLNEIKITVNKTNPLRQVVTIFFPEDALPLKRETVTLGAPDASGNQTVTAYHSSSYEAGSLPIRFFYTVSVTDAVKNDKGQVVASKLSADYRENFTDEKGNISFLANLYEPNENYEDSYEDAPKRYAQDAQANFYPSKQNRYYYFQESHVIYATATGGNASHEGIIGTTNGPVLSDPVTDIASIKDDANYYFVVDYYRPKTGTTTGERVQMAVSRTGKELHGSLGYSTTDTARAATGPAAGVVVTTEVGTPRLGDLDQFVTLKGYNPKATAQTEGGNVTDTAETSFLPTNVGTGDNQHMEVFLGNNGRLKVSPTGLLVTKRVADVAEGISYDHDKAYTFHITVDGASGNQTAQVYAYNSAAGSFEATGETRTITLSDEGEATLTLKENEGLAITGLPGGASWTVVEDKQASGLQDDRTTPGYALLAIAGAGTTTSDSPYTRTGSLTNGAIAEVDYVNTYTVPATFTWELPITKVLQGRNFTNSDQFTFVMTPAGSPSQQAATPLPSSAQNGVYSKTLGPGLSGSPVENDGNASAWEASQKLLMLGGDEDSTVTFTRPGDYAYLIREQRPTGGDALPGVSYDGEVYRLTIRVSADSQTNSLYAEPIQLARRASGTQATTGTESDYNVVWTSKDAAADLALTFTNRYREDAVERTFEGHKILEGLPDGSPFSMAGAFSFVLTAEGAHEVTDDSLYNEISDSSTATTAEKRAYLDNLAESAWNESELQVPMPGNGSEGYTYSNEVQASTDSGGYVQFDSVEYRDGLPETSTDVDRNHGVIYRYQLREVQPTEDGTMTGAPLPAGSDGDGRAWPAASRNAEGQWVYKGVTYTNDVITFYVWVHLDAVADSAGSGTVLHTALFGNVPFSAQDGHSAITNTYRSETSLPVAAVKHIDGRAFHEGDVFSFRITGSVITGSAGAVAPLPSGTEAESGDTSGTITIEPTEGTEAAVDFGTLNFTQADAGNIYHYELSEVPGDTSGITYDTSIAAFDVSVTDDGAGNLTAAVTQNGEPFDASSAITWKNVYTPEPATVHFEGTKILLNRQLDANMFGFTVTPCDSAGNPLEDETPWTVSNAAGTDNGNGSWSAGVSLLSPERYQFNTAGTYYFLVAEIPGEADATASTIYDDTRYLLEVPVTDDTDGRLVVGDITVAKRAGNVGAFLDEPSGKATFVNAYQGVSFTTLTLDKQIIGRSPAGEAGKYHFALEVLDDEGNVADGCVLPANPETANDEDGTATFDPVVFTAPGTYKVLVHEKQPTVDGTFEGQPLEGATKINVAGQEKWYHDGMIYDPHVAESTVLVTRQNDGSLRAELTGTATPHVFLNDAGITVAKTVTGSDAGVNTDELFAFTLSAWTVAETGDNASAPVEGEFPFVVRDRESGQVLDEGSVVLTTTTAETGSENTTGGESTANSENSAGIGSGRFTLKAGQEIQIVGLPNGCHFVVSEVLTDEQKTAGWVLDSPVAGATGVLAADVDASFEFVNRLGAPPSPTPSDPNKPTLTVADTEGHTSVHYGSVPSTGDSAPWAALSVVCLLSATALAIGARKLRLLRSSIKITHS